MLSRRHFLHLAGLIAASVTASACAPVYRRLAGEPALPAEWPALSDANFAALSRMTFGPRPEDRARAANIGLAGWIEEQLAFDSIDDSSLHWRLQNFETLNLSATELLDWSEGLFDDVDQQSVPRELARASLVRQTYSRRQLYEVMVEFWSDHFNISTEKDDCFFLKTVDDREVIRPQALGNFRDLLWASAHSPAMLFYLDNQVNHKEHPNENYAREVMELHTLSVDGGYTQQDVMELARCLTGWTVKDSFWRGEFTFNQDFHDLGPKTVLGLTIEPDGQREAERVLEMLAAHPSTARFVSFKLARRFIADDPPEDLVSKGAEAFTKNNGDIRAVLRVILLDGLSQLQPKFKRPVDFVVSALRLLNAHTEISPPLLEYLVRLGQVPFRWPTPDGYPMVSAPWMGNLQPRWQFALALARNEIEGTQIDLPNLVQLSGASGSAELTEKLSALILGVPLPVAARNNLLDSLNDVDEADLPALLAAGLIASPAFQWR
jgi:hypothetical protein